MSRRRNLERHRRSLGEIRSVMNSMKTLAYMETRKLYRFADAQRQVVESMERAAGVLLNSYPGLFPGVNAAAPIFLVIGSERGFCGDFNRNIRDHLESAVAELNSAATALLVVGRNLQQIMEDSPLPVIALEGPAIVEETTAVLNEVVDALLTLQSQREASAVFGIYHRGEKGTVTQRLLPPFQSLPESPRSSLPPLLNLPPEEFLQSLAEQYLFAILNEMFYASLTEENHQRVAHLDGAVRHLDDESEDLRRQCNALRQEEIIEEIENILLNAPNGGSGLSRQQK